MDIEIDEEYDFILAPKIIPDYKISSYIADWLKTNMETLTDINNEKVFGKVNFGYDEEILKSFGKKPVCNVYINQITFTSDLQINKPTSVSSFIICYLKGKINKTYVKACDLTDYLIQEFMSNDEYRRNDVVSNTTIEDVRVTLVPVHKRYGVLCALELKHHLKQ